MKRRAVDGRSPNLFSFFKPVSSPANGSSTAAASPAKKKKSPNSADRPHSTPARNGTKSKSRSPGSVSMATDSATPSTSGSKRPRPPDSDSDEEIGIKKVSKKPKNCVFAFFPLRPQLVVRRGLLP